MRKTRVHHDTPFYHESAFFSIDFGVFGAHQFCLFSSSNRHSPFDKFLKRLAICMTCGRVGSWKDRPTFEELAVMFEGSSASGAERAYRKAAEHLTLLLVENGGVHAVRLKQKSKTKRKKKVTIAVYEYQADCDGEWGEIIFDFENGTESIVRLADWDTMISNIFAKQAIRYLLDCENEKLPKETMFAFEIL